MQIETVGTVGCDVWDSYVARVDTSLIYGSSRFMRLLCEHLGAEPLWIVATRNGDICGLMPAMYRGGPLGGVLNSLAYYGSNGGIIQHAPDDEAKLALLEEFYGLAARRGCISATVITNPLLQDDGFYDSHAAHDLRDERIGLITHFPPSGDPEDLLAQLEDPRPRNIRRAVNAGINVERRQDPAALDFLYATHEQNMAAVGGISKRADFFQRIPDVMTQRDWSVYVASLNGEPVAALLLFYFNRTVEYFTPVVVEHHRPTQALSLIIYRAMQDAMTDGFLNWNWGGTWVSQKGVYDFKKRWGTTEYPYYYFTRVLVDSARTQSREFLQDQYAGFFVIPFSALETP